MPHKKQVVILLFSQVEDLDYVGPLEIFNRFGSPGENPAFNVTTVCEHGGEITTANGLALRPAHSFANCPQPDVLVVPGGKGSRKEIENPACVAWVKQAADNAEAVLSVCTGSLILAKAGLLEGLNATTHFSVMDLLAELAPGAVITPGVRFADNGKFVISAGVSAGIDAALHMVGRTHGVDSARDIARYLEYEYFREG